MRAVVDHHVDRPDVQVRQRMQLTGTNRSIGLISEPTNTRNSSSQATENGNQVPGNRHEAPGVRNRNTGPPLHAATGNRYPEPENHIRRVRRTRKAKPTAARSEARTAQRRLSGLRPNGPVKHPAPADRYQPGPTKPTPPYPLQPPQPGFMRPGGHSEGPNTRSHPELGRENPPRPWYCVSRRGRVGRRQVP